MRAYVIAAILVFLSSTTNAIQQTVGGWTRFTAPNGLFGISNFSEQGSSGFLYFRCDKDLLEAFILMEGKSSIFRLGSYKIDSSPLVNFTYFTNLGRNLVFFDQSETQLLKIFLKKAARFSVMIEKEDYLSMTIFDVKGFEQASSFLPCAK